jgi:hypothetical protein
MPYTKCSECAFGIDHGQGEWVCHKLRDPAKRLDLWHINDQNEKFLPQWEGCGEGERASLNNEDWRPYSYEAIENLRGYPYRAWVVAKGEADPHELLCHMPVGSIVDYFWQQGENSTKNKWTKLPAHWEIVAWRPRATKPPFVKD